MKTEGLKKETAVRTAALAISLLNQIMVVLGKDILPFTDDQIYAGISTCATVIIALWNWWKNNSFTEAAIQGDKVKDGIKELSR